MHQRASRKHHVVQFAVIVDGVVSMLRIFHVPCYQRDRRVVAVVVGVVVAFAAIKFPRNAHDLCMNRARTL